MYEIARIAPFRVKTGEKGNSRVPDRCVRRSAEALTSHYLLREGVELRFESPLRTRRDAYQLANLGAVHFVTDRAGKRLGQTSQRTQSSVSKGGSVRKERRATTRSSG